MTKKKKIVFDSYVSLVGIGFSNRYNAYPILKMLIMISSYKLLKSTGRKKMYETFVTNLEPIALFH
jgi:hypothetical protein